MANLVLIHHTKNGYVKTAVIPPRLCEWTTDIDDAQVFETQSEATVAKEFISTHAFLVEVVDNG